MFVPVRAGANEPREEPDRLGERNFYSVSIVTCCASHTPLSVNDVLPLRLTLRTAPHTRKINLPRAVCVDTISPTSPPALTCRALRRGVQSPFDDGVRRGPELQSVLSFSSVLLFSASGSDTRARLWERLGERKDDSLSIGTICASHTTLGGSDVLPLRHVLKPFAFLRQATSRPSLLSATVCAKHTELLVYITR